MELNRKRIGMIAMLVAVVGLSATAIFIGLRLRDAEPTVPEEAQAACDWKWKGHDCGTPNCACTGANRPDGGNCVEVKNDTGCGWSCYECTTTGDDTGDDDDDTGGGGACGAGVTVTWCAGWNCPNGDTNGDGKCQTVSTM